MRDDIKPRIVGLVQARMGSRRLPNKMMLHLHGCPVVEWVCRRASKARLMNRLVVVIPDTPLDDILELYLTQSGFTIFRGSETDVVERFYLAAQAFGATHVVRICADNPLTSGEEIDHLIQFYFSNPCDYAYNQGIKDNRYPDGLGAEIIAFDILELIHREARQPAQREHVCNFLWDNPERFTIKTFDPPDPEIAFPHLKLDIDTPADYLKFLSKNLSPDMGSREIVAVFSE